MTGGAVQLQATVRFYAIALPGCCSPALTLRLGGFDEAFVFGIEVERKLKGGGNFLALSAEPLRRAYHIDNGAAVSRDDYALEILREVIALGVTMNDQMIIGSECLAGGCIVIIVIISLQHGIIGRIVIAGLGQFLRVMEMRGQSAQIVEAGITEHVARPNLNVRRVNVRLKTDGGEIAAQLGELLLDFFRSFLVVDEEVGDESDFDAKAHSFG